MQLINENKHRTGVQELTSLKTGTDTDYTNRKKHKGVCIEFGSRTKFQGMARWLPLSLIVFLSPLDGFVILFLAPN